MTRPQVFVTPDHRSVDHYAALLADGTPAPDTRTDRMSPLPGHAGCSCGLVSPGPLGSRQKRKAWHTVHREEAAGAPWSDSVRDGEQSKWPAIFDAEVRDALHPDGVWHRASPNCWEVRSAREGFMVHACVIETMDGTGDAWIGHTVGDNVSVGFVEKLRFRMLDALADRTRPVWEVGCRTCGEAWPCPLRERHVFLEPRPDALDHVPYGVIRHG